MHETLNERENREQTNRNDMFFLPAELAKEARNEVLTHRVGGWAQIRISDITFGHVILFSFSCHKQQLSHPPTHLLFLVSLHTVTHVLHEVELTKRKKKRKSHSQSFCWYEHCIWVVSLQIKCCCILMWADKWHPVYGNLTRWSGDVIRRTGEKNFSAVSHNRARPYFWIQHGRGEVRSSRFYLKVHSETGNVVDTE